MQIAPEANTVFRTETQKSLMQGLPVGPSLKYTSDSKFIGKYFLSFC